jgi:O-antigen ligase
MSEERINEIPSEWNDATVIEPKHSRLSSFIFIWICINLVFSTVAYGAVDAWAWGFLSFGAIVTIILWTIETLKNKTFKLSTNSLQIPLIGLLLIGLIQLLPFRDFGISNDLLAIPSVSSLSLDPYSTRFAIVQLFIFGIFFASALTFINDQKRLRKMAFLIIIFGSLMAFFGILQRLAGTESIYGLRPTPGAIPFASFVNRHHFASFMLMTIGITLSLLYGKALVKEKQFLGIFAAILMGLAIIFTGSRGGLLSFFGVLAFVLVAHSLNKDEDEKAESSPKNKFAIIGVSFALVLVLIFGVLYLGGGDSMMRSLGLGQGLKEDFSTGRFHIWQITLQIIRDYPILGAGLDAFGVAYTKYDTSNGNMAVLRAHNDYLQILADAGILGFSCVIGFIVLLFKKGLPIIAKSKDKFRKSVAIGSLGGCLGILIHSFFDFPLRTPSNMLFFLTLVTLAVATIHYPTMIRRTRRD